MQHYNTGDFNLLVEYCKWYQIIYIIIGTYVFQLIFNVIIITSLIKYEKMYKVPNPDKYISVSNITYRVSARLSNV